MKKCIGAAFAAVCMMIGTSVSAQQVTRTTIVATNAPMSEEMMQVQVQKMCRELSLDRKQADRVCRASRRIARQREKLAQTCRESAAEVQQVLTPEQFAQWKRYALPSMDMKSVYRVDPQVMMRRDRTHRYDGPKGPKCQMGDCPRAERRREHRHHRRAIRMNNTQTNDTQTAVEILPVE